MVVSGPVLILILMEVPQWEVKTPGYEEPMFSLNPYSNGSTTMGLLLLMSVGP